MQRFSADSARATYRKIRRWVGRPSPTKKLFFLHLPKCGGSSVDAAMRQIYICAGYPVTHLNPTASRWAAEIAGENLMEFRTRLLLYYMSENHSWYISGHFTYSERAWSVFSDEWQFLTVLREPVARWYSHYFFNHYKKSDHFSIDEPLEEFIESERARGYGRSYVDQLVEQRETDADNMVECAIANLQRFPLVGLLEEMDTFTRDCEQFLGVPITIRHHNKNPRPRQKRNDEMIPEIDERVRALCEPNRQVYQVVQERIKQRGSWLNY